MDDGIFLTWLVVGLWILVLIYWRVPLKTRFYFLLVFLLILAVWKAVYLSDYQAFHWFFAASAITGLAAAASILHKRQSLKP